MSREAAVVAFKYEVNIVTTELPAMHATRNLARCIAQKK